MARYTLLVGNKNVSSWSMRAWLPMKVAGIPFEEVGVRLYQPDTRQQILVHSPSGRVPLLKIEEDGGTQTVWDSLAICETLAERHPDKHLWPEDARARAHARAIVSEMHSGFPDVRRQLSMDISARIPTPELEGETRDQIERILEIWDDALDTHPNGGFLFGHFTIADAFYAPVVTRFTTYGVKLTDTARKYCDRILALPAMHEWIRAARIEIEAT